MKATGGKTRYLILGLLAERPLTGYEIKKIVDTRFSYFWSESYGQIYPELARLAQEGLVRESIAAQRRKDKKRYQMTAEGERALRQWLQMPVETEVVRLELLLKLYFSGTLPSPAVAEHIKAFALAHRRRLELFDQFEQQLRQSRQPGDGHEEILMTLLFGQMVGRAYVQWSREALRRLEERDRTKEDDAGVAALHSPGECGIFEQ